MNKKLFVSSLLTLIFCIQFLKINAQNTDSTINEKNFTNLEDALKNPDKVYRLDLSNQFLKNTQYESLSKFKNLVFLSLKNDHLKEIPKNIYNLSNLRILDLSGNDFKFLSKDIKKLKKLEEIYLNDEPYADINQELGVLEKLPKLRILHLENDKIGVLPKSLNNLKYLEKLYLNDNEFKEFPSFLTQNKKLLYIDMKNNPLQWKGERPFGLTINF